MDDRSRAGCWGLFELSARAARPFFYIRRTRLRFFEKQSGTLLALAKGHRREFMARQNLKETKQEQENQTGPRTNKEASFKTGQPKNPPDISEKIKRVGTELKK